MGRCGAQSVSVTAPSFKVLVPAIIMMRHLACLLLSLLLASVTSLPAPEAGDAVTPLSVTPEVPALDTVEETEAVSEPNPEAESEPEPEAESEPASAAPEAAKAEPKPEPESEPEAESEPYPETEAEPESEPESEAESEPYP